MPKGRTSFNEAGADDIRVLLSQTRNSSRPQQKGLRQRFRDIGFYISDFGRPSTGFGVADFDKLVASGQIRIIR